MYPFREEKTLKDNLLKDEVHKWLTGLITDPISNILIKNSALTKTQMETFLIDVLAEKISGKSLLYEEKARLRLMKSGVSRGAFNRTLAQARKNIIRSIYTIILLGYLGVFEGPRLDPYIEIANKIHIYTEAYKEAWRSKNVKSEHLRIVKMLQREIEKGLKDLSQPKSMSGKA
jgi:hypothetical protein